MNVLAVLCMFCACKIKLSSCLDLPLSHSSVAESYRHMQGISIDHKFERGANLLCMH